MEQTSTVTTQIEKAVNWWSEKLSSKPNQDMGEAYTNATINFIMMFMKPPAAEQVKQFKQELTSHLQQVLGERQECSLNVDYDPQDDLLKVAKAVGLEDCRYFPVKTIMYVTHDNVRVACGYGAPFVEL